MIRNILTSLLAVAALGFGGAALAQAQSHQHGQHGQHAGGQMPGGMMMKGDMSMYGGPAGQANMQAMHDMHQAMMGATDRDPDRAFAKMMIEHHKGGIAMAEIQARHGDDAELKRMAQKTIEMQRREIAELQRWLERHGGR